MTLDRETASVMGRLGAVAKHSRHDPGPGLVKARAALESSWLRKAREQAAERGEEVSEQELERRSHYLREEHYARLALAATLARKKAKAAKKRAKE